MRVFHDKGIHPHQPTIWCQETKSDHWRIGFGLTATLLSRRQMLLHEIFARRCGPYLDVGSQNHRKFCPLPSSSVTEGLASDVVCCRQTVRLSPDCFYWFCKTWFSNSQTFIWESKYSRLHKTPGVVCSGYSWWWWGWWMAFEKDDPIQLLTLRWTIMMMVKKYGDEDDGDNGNDAHSCKWHCQFTDAELWKTLTV